MVHGLPYFGFLCFCVLGSCILDIRHIHRFHRQKKNIPTPSYNKKTKTPAPAILEYSRSFFCRSPSPTSPPQKQRVFSETNNHHKDPPCCRFQCLIHSSPGWHLHDIYPVIAMSRRPQPLLHHWTHPWCGPWCATPFWNWMKVRMFPRWGVRFFGDLERQVSYFLRQLYIPLKPATIALKIGHKRLSREGDKKGWENYWVSTICWFWGPAFGIRTLALL